MNAAELQELGPPSAELFARLRSRLDAMLTTLPDKPEETSESALRCLWHLASGKALSPDAAAELPLVALTSDGQTQLERLVESRVSGIPLAHLSGRQRFMGLELLAGPQALIPRRETELLAGEAIRTLREQILSRRDRATVIDSCTGCGNVAIAIAHANPRVTVLASDLSPEAVELAQKNVDFVGLGQRVELRVGDLLQPFDEPRFHRSVDMITCNPPYISTKKMETMPSEIIGFEPKLAFDGGALGVRILQRLIREAPKLLCEGGWLLFEVGLGQGNAVMQRMSNAGGYDRVDGLKDHAGEIRAVIARCL
jgi:release factor glutamine methyltransferase